MFTELIPLGKAKVDPPANASLSEHVSGPAERSLVRPRPTSLFRPEALAAQQEPELGTLLLVQPISAKAFTLLAIAAAAGLIAFSFYGEYTRKAPVSGYLVPTQGLIKVYANETGTIVDLKVAEGQKVSKGDVLFVLSMERRSREAVDAQAAAMAMLRARRASLDSDLTDQAQIAEVDLASLKQRITATESELAQLAQELVTQERRVASAEITLQRQQKLVAMSLAPADQIQDKERDVLEQQGKLQALRRDEIRLRRDLATLGAEVSAARFKTQTHQGAIERDISALEQELTEYEARRSVAVTAPASGTATALLASLGQTAQSTQPLVSIIPESAALEAHFFVPSRSIGFVTVDLPVSLKYEAFPYQRFGTYHGMVKAVSRTLILPSETAMPSLLSEPAYRVTVALESQAVKAYGQDFLLKPGMLVRANIWLDRRKLYEWLLDPLYSVVGKMS